MITRRQRKNLHFEKKPFASLLRFLQLETKPVMIIESACLLIPPNCFHCYECVVTNFFRHSAISYKYVSLWCLLFDPHLSTHQSNIGV
jgi:hypothetical protein